MGRYDQNKGKRSGRYNPANNKSANGVHVIVVIILVLLAGIGGFFARQLMDEVNPEMRALAIPSTTENGVESQQTGATTDDKLTQTSDVSKSANEGIETLRPVEELIVLPELDSSDTSIRASVAQIAPQLAPWLNTRQLIRSYMLIANDFSQGMRIDKHLSFLKLDEPFAVDQSGSDLLIAAKSYQRYDKLAQAINAIDAPAILVVYKKFRPLLLQVFNEFSYPAEYSLEDIFTKAAAEILAAPAIDEPIAVTRFSSRYKFADPQLEALNPVHKQMIRMGPENTRIIQDKVRLLIEEMADLKY